MFTVVSCVAFAQVDSTQAGSTDSLALNPGLATVEVATISASDLESDEESQDISSLLQSSRDVFASTAGFTFGPARYKIRGYGSENTGVSINGIPVNDMESGGAYYSTWGGLNDATRNTVVGYCIAPTETGFGGIGGLTNINTRASKYRKQVKASYSITNKNYRNRLMVTASTGLMENGVAVTLSGSRRWAQEGYVEGTFYDAYAYFLSAEKIINNQHSVGFTFFGAPSQRAKQGLATQEAYDLVGSNYYNPYWGYQNGEKRNSRVSNTHKPMMILNHYWDIDDDSKLTTGLSYSFGRGGSTALNWYNAQDPRPDYYRYLPSYYTMTDPDMADWLTTQWQNGERSQVNWDFLYAANADEYARIENANGTGETVEGKRSKYIIEERRNDHQRITLNTQYDRQLNENLLLRAGVNLDWYKGFRFKEMSDLLGGDFWLDVDQFAERDFVDPDFAQSDLNNQNNIIEVGDRFGYDYTANVNDYSAFLQTEFTYKKVDFYVAANAGFNQFWRTGNMLVGKFPDNSYGDSEKNNFFNYGAKAGATYKITGRHYLSANAAYITRPPYFRNAYISPRTRDNVVDGLSNEIIYSGDLNYNFRAPWLKARVSVFYTEFQNQVMNRSFYHDELHTFVNYIMKDVNMLNIGGEMGFEAKVTPTVSITGAAAKGDFLYNSRPTVTIAEDNSSEVLVENRTVYMKNYRVGGMPQTIASGGLKYFSPKYWMVGFNVNYLDDIYIDVNPDRRTDAALNRLAESDPWIDQILEQERIGGKYTIDVYGYKSWKVKEYTIMLNLSINNLLGNSILGGDDIITGGYEQLRYNPRRLDKFPPKYFYMYGTSYFVNLSLRF